MTDLWFPDVRIQKLAPRLIDNTGRFSSPFTQATRTISRGGDRWGFTLTLNDLAGVDRARVESLIANLRGAANRVLFSPIDFPQRGSFPSRELMPNNNFANGITGWTLNGGTLTVTDRRLRVTFSGTARPQLVGTVSIAPNIPYVARYFLVDGKGSPLSLGALLSFMSGSTISTAVTSVEGLDVLSLVLDGSGPVGQSVVYGGNAGVIPVGQIAGNYADVVWTSFSQCALVDNAPNLLRQSNAFGTSPWALTNATVTASGSAAPDGSGTAQDFHENTTSGSHATQQSLTVGAGAADFSFSVCVNANTRTWCLLVLAEVTGGTNVQASFNIATGALGTTNVGANWANLRTFVENLGSSWYRVTIVARKTNAATGLQALLYAESADNVTTYAGVGTNIAFLLWEAVVAQSSVPTRRSPTAGSANPGIAQTGSACYVKGAPPSATGLLLPGDWFEINKELKRVTAQLDSNAAGLGYLQFSPPIRNSPADSDPVIVNMPMGRFIMSATETGWDASPAGLISGPRATYTLDLVEAA